MSRSAHRWTCTWMLAGLIGCQAGADGGDTDTDVVDAGPSLAGTWSAVSGDGAPLDSYALGEVEHLTFEGDGRSGALHLFGVDEPSGVLGCPTALYAGGEGGALLVSSSNLYSGTRLLIATFADDDTLELADESGLVQRFARAESVPAASVCGVLTVVDDQSLDFEPSSWANVLWDGTSVVVPDSDGLFWPVDPATGMLGTSYNYGTSYEHVVTLQGADGWGHCACGGSEDVVRTSPGGAQVDTVDMRDFAPEIGVRSAAWDGEHLIVNGYSYAESESFFQVIDADAEPDLLVASYVDHVDADQLVQHGDLLLGVSGTRVVSIDLETGKADGTWELPGAYGTTYWRGITSDGTHVFLLGQQPDGAARLISVTLQ